MSRRASRRVALEEAIRLRDEAAQLYVKLDGLVQSLIAEEAAAQRGGQHPRELRHPRNARQDRSVSQSLVLHGYAILDEHTGECCSSPAQLTVEGAAASHPDTRADSSTRDERPEVRHRPGDAAASPGNDDSSER